MPDWELIHELFPKARVVADRFHILKMADDAVTFVRTEIPSVRTNIKIRHSFCARSAGQKTRHFVTVPVIFHAQLSPIGDSREKNRYVLDWTGGGLMRRTGWRSGAVALLWASATAFAQVPCTVQLGAGATVRALEVPATVMMDVCPAPGSAVVGASLDNPAYSGAIWESRSVLVVPDERHRDAVLIVVTAPEGQALPLVRHTVMLRSRPPAANEVPHGPPKFSFTLFGQ